MFSSSITSECDAHALMRFDSEPAHLGENLFSFDIIEYLFHTSMFNTYRVHRLDLSP